MSDVTRTNFQRPACSAPATGQSPAAAPPRSPFVKDIYIGRQGIFDRNMGILAYELLYRSSHENSAGVFEGDHATSQVAVNAFLDLGLEHVVGDRLAFVNLTRNFLIGEHPVPFPPERVVLEVLEDIPIDGALVAGVHALADRGYAIALDDCVYSDCLSALLEYATYVKIDIQALGLEQVRRHVEAFRNYPVKLIAEKVETQQEYEICRELGFDYFQGYFLCLPKVLTGQSIPDNKLNILRLLAALQDPGADTAELVRIISQDIGLSYKLLRYINSAFFGLQRRIESIQQALVYIGLDAVRTWSTLLVMRNVHDKPGALASVGLTRARMCELLARARGHEHPQSYFTVGLFSIVDAMMDAPMERILNALPFTPQVTGALLEHQGDMGGMLARVIAYERGEWDAAAHDLSAELLANSYLESIAWADQVMASLT